MQKNRLTDEAIKKAQLSKEDLNNLVGVLESLVYFAADERILYLDHFGSLRKYKWIRGRFRRTARFGEGDLISTNYKLLYAEHPISRIRKGWFSVERIVYHDECFKPIALNMDLGEITRVSIERRYLGVEYSTHSSDFKLHVWGNYEDTVDFQVALEKAIDAYRYAKSRPKLEVVHKGTVVNLKVDSKGFLLNVEPCPVCGANLYLSQDRKTAYCPYCKKEIPTVEQMREG